LAADRPEAGQARGCCEGVSPLSDGRDEFATSVNIRVSSRELAPPSIAVGPKGEEKPARTTARTGKRPRRRGDFVAPDRTAKSPTGVELDGSVVRSGCSVTLRPTTRMLGSGLSVPQTNAGPALSPLRTIAPGSSAVLSSRGTNLLRSDRPKRATVVLRASVSSDRSAQRGSRVGGEGGPPNKEGTLSASSAARVLRKKTHPVRDAEGPPGIHGPKVRATIHLSRPCSPPECRHCS
jgi:hypothetical protein